MNTTASHYTDDYLWLKDDAWRTERVMAHILGSAPETDRLIYRNPDISLFLSLGLSQSQQYLFIVLEDHQSSEIRYLPVNEPASQPQLIEPRRDNIKRPPGNLLGTGQMDS